MQKTVAVAFLIALINVSAFAVAPEASGWVKYTSPKGHYSVLLPHEPEATSQETTTPAGDKLTQYLATAEDSPVTCTVAYFDYAKGMAYSLAKGRDGMVEAVKGTLLHENAVSLGGHPGLELKISASEGEVEYIIHARFYDMGGRIYILQCMTPKAENNTAVAEKRNKFFDSFQVAKTP
jgi:hypothetical protein